MAGRRLAGPPTVTVLLARSWSIALVALALLVATCGQEAEEPAPSPAPSMTGATPTSTEPTPSVEPTSPTPTRSPTTPVGEVPVFLVFGTFGLGLLSDGVVEPFCPLAGGTGCPAGGILEAAPDLMGGVIFQPLGSSAIRRLRAGVEAPETLVPPNELGLRILDVELAQGAPSLLYATGTHVDEMGATSYEVLLRDLQTGRERTLFTFNTFEGGVIQASIGRSYVSSTEQGSSDQGSARFYAFDGRPARPPFRPEHHRLEMGDCWKGAFAPGTDRFAYVGALSDCGAEPWQLKWVDLRTGERSTVDVDLDGPVFDGAIGLEAFGRTVLVTRLDEPPLLVRGEVVTEVVGVPVSIYDLVEADRPAECPRSAVGDDLDRIWCWPIGGVLRWRA